MSILGVKDKIGKLVNQLDAHSKESNLQDTSSKFIQPFFESLGWDFNTDVKSENFENSTIKAFQIDNVTRFYLKEFPLSSSLESLNEEIKSCASYGFNKGVTWVVVTNFKETKVYNTESTGRTLASMQYHKILASEYIENFKNLSDLTKKQFSLNVLDNGAEYFGKKPKRITIDKQLLEDLLYYRNILVNDIVKENSISENDAEHAAQKILNRLIFIRSCGDRQIENRFLIEELHKWEEKKDKKLIYHLQDIFSYFRGRYGSTLFEKHRCDELIISDNVLQQVIEGTYQSKKKAVRYNFAHIEHDSLGKMYENYLGTVQQKKDGAYYTPSYISKYICQNTIIPYLSKSNVTNIHELISEYSGDLNELESKIHSIKILDPACGTGEFLIRAIDILLEISKEIQIQKETKGHYTHTVKGKKSGSIAYQTFDKDVENQELRIIIRNNIHGVDINEEAIEIAQLNLFLKLATSSQQLMDVSKNILVGNALVDDPSVDPNAFDWEKIFPEKFDVIIGNPPYVKEDVNRIIFEHVKKTNMLQYYQGKMDYWYFFTCKALDILKIGGYHSFVAQNNWITSDGAKILRNKILEDSKILSFWDFNEFKVFQNASIQTMIYVLEKTKKQLSSYQINYFKVTQKNISTEQIRNCLLNNEKDERVELYSTNIEPSDLKNKTITFTNQSVDLIIKKITKSSNYQLNNDEVFSGIDVLQDFVSKDHLTKLNDNSILKGDGIFVLSTKEKLKMNFNKIELKKILPYYTPEKLNKFFGEIKNDYWILYADKEVRENIKTYPTFKKHLDKFKPVLTSVWKPYGLHRPREQQSFEGEKILSLRKTKQPSCTFINFSCYVARTFLIIKSKNIDLKFLTGLLNSKLGYFFFYYKGKKQGEQLQIDKTPLLNFPIKLPKNNDENLVVKNIINLVNSILETHKELQQIQLDVEKQTLEQKITSFEEEIDQNIFQLYSLDESEISNINSSLTFA